MKLLRALLVLSGVAFVVVLAIGTRRRVDSDVHERYVGELHRLRTLNARVNETVLRGRLGITRSFDPLAAMMQETSIVHAELRAVPSYLDDATRARVLAGIVESATFQRARQRNIERFTMEDAALAASVHILAPETTALAARVEVAGGKRLADHARTLRVELLELAAAREPGHVAEIESAIVELRGQAATWPDDEDRKAAERLITHVRQVMQRRLRVDALTREIVTEAAMERASAIDAAYVAGVEAARESWTRTLGALFFLLLVMLGSASAYVITRLRTSAAELGAATTELSATLSLLREERAKEKELADLKTRFIAMTSHEFRTPLSVISSSAELLQAYGERWASEKRSEHLSRIRRSVLGMTTMLDRILLIGKTEAKMLEFRPEPVDLPRLCAEIAGSIEQAGGAKRPIARRLDPDLGVAWADESLLRHILSNLLSNAVKYSPEGEEIRFSAERDGDDVVFAVSDHGIGIPEEDRARLFDGFHRARNALHISGTGLGLPVVKHAAELHGGAVELDSVVGEGTTFRVRVRARREGPAMSDGDDGMQGPRETRGHGGRS